MDPTESERTLERVPGASPVLRLLYCAGVIFAQPLVFALPRGASKIGRDVAEREGIRLPLSRRASREHAVFEVEEKAGSHSVTLRDLGSKNGTHINGQLLSARQLVDGDIVRIGDALLHIAWESAKKTDTPIARLQGVSSAMCTLRRRIAELAAAAAPVLVLGESGTGKELVAQSLHELSGRSGRLVSVNCSAIPESLAESQLFGHLSGSFTGATTAQEGLFRAAQGGTLFLDEVGDLPAAVQPKLLRVLEDRMLSPIGSTRTLKVDVRIIAATHRDLKADIAAGRFRADLYARLCALDLFLPPLRARREDILLLLGSALGPDLPPLSTALAEALLRHDWPLNVRELFQLATHLRYCAAGLGELDLPQVAGRLSLPPPSSARLQPALPTSPTSPAEPVVISDSDEEEPVAAGAPPPRPLPREEVERLLKEHHGIVARVAAAAGRSPRQVRRWIEQYKIDPKRLA